MANLASVEGYHRERDQDQSFQGGKIQARETAEEGGECEANKTETGEKEKIMAAETFAGGG